VFLLHVFHPFDPQGRAPLGILFIQEHGLRDPVDAEAAKIFAVRTSLPDAAGFKITDRNRPDGAFGVAALLVAIVQPDFPAGVNMRAVVSCRWCRPLRPTSGARLAGSSASGCSRSGSCRRSWRSDPVRRLRQHGVGPPGHHCAPRTAASISSGVSISGGMSKPFSST
jgi:hypothetical protein